MERQPGVSMYLQRRVPSFCCGRKTVHFVAFFALRSVTSAYSLCCRHCISGPVALLYVVTFVLVLPILFRHVRHSLFYSQPNDTVLLAAARKANSDRIVQAEMYFSSLNGSVRAQEERTNTSPDGTLTVALIVVTVSRDRHRIDNYEPKYLTQTVWKFHSLLNRWRPKNRFLRIQMSICNVDDDVASYGEANALSKHVPMFSRFTRRHVSTVHALEKEKDDYVFCLSKSLEIHKDAGYLFVVEDDALPTDDLFDVLQRVLEMHTERLYVRGEYRSRSSNVAFVKFFHPDRLLNFISFQPERLPELVAYAALLSTLLLAAVSAVACMFSPTNSSKSVNVLWKKLFLFSLVVTLACGRTGMSAWRRLALPRLYSYTPVPSCCTQALLFPRSSALLTVNYLNSNTCTDDFGKDSVLDNMLKDLQMTAYLVQPNTFTHIGIYSSLRNHIVNPLLM